MPLCSSSPPSYILGELTLELSFDSGFVPLGNLCRGWGSGQDIGIALSSVDFVDELRYGTRNTSPRR